MGKGRNVLGKRASVMLRVVKAPIAVIAFVVAALVATCAMDMTPRSAWADAEPQPLAAGEMLEANSIISLSDISWNRIYGQTALDTMEAITQAGNYPDNGTVVLVTVDGFWDALAAAGIAGLADAPVIMTDGKSLSVQAERLLSTLKPNTIIVGGGSAAIADSVENAATTAAGGAAVKRCGGTLASDTAIEIFKQAPIITGQAWDSRAFVCTDESYYDAMSAAPLSYALHMPIFLTNGPESISSATLAALKEGGFESVYIVGGTSAISPDIERAITKSGVNVAGRLWGQTAIETSGEVAAFGLQNGMAVEGLGVATSNGYWDALAGAAFCGRSNTVLVLADVPECSTIQGFIRSNAAGIEHGVMFGGPAAVGYNIELALNDQPYDTWSTLFRTYRDDANVNQLLFVKGTGGSDAVIELHQKADGQWTCVLACQGWVGRNGMGPTSEGRETTPVGDFGITGAFGVAPSPGTQLSYLQVNDSHYWCSDEYYYNQLIDIYSNPHYCIGEHLIEYQTAYEYGLFFDYNTNPVVYGAGSAFFVHCKINAPYTAGCVMMDRSNMTQVIQMLSPGARVCIFAQ